MTERHRVIWFDNRGTGQSGSTRKLSIRDLASDALAVLDAAGVEQAHVYGVSMGGGTAMQLALDAPDRVTALVLGCTRLKTTVEPGPGRLAVLKYAVPRRVLKKVFRAMMYGPVCPAEMADRDLDVLMTATIDPRGVAAQAGGQHCGVARLKRRSSPMTTEHLRRCCPRQRREPRH